MIGKHHYAWLCLPLFVCLLVCGEYVNDVYVCLYVLARMMNLCVCVSKACTCCDMHVEIRIQLVLLDLANHLV